MIPSPQPRSSTLWPLRARGPSATIVFARRAAYWSASAYSRSENPAARRSYFSAELIGRRPVSRVSQRPQPLRVLTDEANDPAPVPERAAGEQAAVGQRMVGVADDGLGHVPPLPACLHCAVLEVDVLTVEAEARV